MALLLAIIGRAQTSLEQMRDSLRRSKAAGDEIAEGEWLSKIGGWYIDHKHWDSAEYYHRASLRLNTRIKQTRLAGVNLNDIGVVFHYRNMLDSSIYYYEKAIPVLESAKDMQMATATGRNLGVVYMNLGLYPEALNVTMKAALYLESQPPSPGLGACYNTIALVYERLNEFESALLFNRKCIRIYRQLGTPMNEARAYNNIANCFNERMQYDSAMHYYLESLKIKREVGEIGATASTLHNIGDLLMKTESPSEAEPYYREALLLKKQFDNQPGKVTTFTALAKVEMSKKNPTVASAYLDSAETIAKEIGLLQELKDIYELRITLNESKGSARDALEYSKALTVVKDSLLTSAKMDELRAITTKYEVGRIEQVLNQEKQLRMAETREKRTWIITLALVIILLTVIGLLIYYQFRMTRKNERRVELLLKELHHRVKNNLQILSSVLTFQSQELTDKGAIEAVRNSESRINAMALIHRKLYRTDHNRTIEMKEYILELIQFLLYSNGYTSDKLKLTVDIDDFELDVDRAIPLGLIINELVNNAFKHAIAKHASPALTVRSKFEQKDVKITISDNGLYPPNPSDELTSFGLKMVNALLQELRGSMESDYRDGTIFQLNIPA